MLDIPFAVHLGFCWFCLPPASACLTPPSWEMRELKSMELGGAGLDGKGGHHITPVATCYSGPWGPSVWGPGGSLAGGSGRG